MPNSAEALRDPTFTEDPATSAPARSTTSPIEIRVTPVLTHERRVRSLARWSRTSLSPAERREASVGSSLGLKSLDLPSKLLKCVFFGHRTQANTKLRTV